MKTMRETFEENYEAVEVPAKNKRGFKIDYQYIGNWYIFGENADQRKKTKMYVGNFTLTSLVLYVAAGIQNSPLNYSRYVELFAMLSLAAFVFEVVGAFQFCMSGEKVTNSAFSDIRIKLTFAPVIYGALLIIASVIGFAEVVSGKMGHFAFLIPACYCLSGCMSLMITYMFVKLPYHIEKNVQAATKK